MADLEKITQQVIDKEKVSLDNKIKKERENAEEEIQAAKQSAEEKKQRQFERIDQDINNQYEIELNSISINERNEKLKIKQSYIEQVLNKVQSKLDAIDAESFKSFTTDILKQFSHAKHLDLVLGEKSKGLIDDNWLSTINIDGLDVSLSDKTVPNESGFLLEDENIEYNFLFSELIKNNKNEYIRQIDQKLFQ